MNKDKNEFVFEWEKTEPAPEVEASPDAHWFNAEETKRQWEKDLDELEKELEELKAKKDPNLSKKIEELEEDIRLTNCFYHWALYD